jgi:hypothetical protein
MLQVVVVFNVLVSLLCWYVAWQVWNLRRALALAAQVLTLAELSTYDVLHNAPNAISVGQLGVHGLRERYQQLELQLQQVQQVLTLLGLGQRILQFTMRRRAIFNSSASSVGASRSRRLQRLQRKRRRGKPT